MRASSLLFIIAVMAASVAAQQVHHDVRVSPLQPAGNRSEDLQMACDLYWDVHLVWIEVQGNRGTVCLASSRRGGDFSGFHLQPPDYSWQTAPRVLSTPGADARHPRIALQGNNVAVVWQQRQATDWDVYCSWSIDGGASWSGPVRVDGNPAPDDAMFPDVAIDHAFFTTGGIHVVWTEDRSGSGRRTYISTAPWSSLWGHPNGPWPGSALALSPPGMVVDAQAPRVLAHINMLAGEVRVVWQSAGVLWSDYSLSNGDAGTWLTAPQRLNTGASAREFDATTAPVGGILPAVVSWIDDRSGGRQVYCRCLRGNLMLEEIKVSRPGTDCFHPVGAIPNNYSSAVVAWEELDRVTGLRRIGRCNDALAHAPAVTLAPASADEPVVCLEPHLSEDGMAVQWREVGASGGRVQVQMWNGRRLEAGWLPGRPHDVAFACNDYVPQIAWIDDARSADPEVFFASPLGGHWLGQATGSASQLLCTLQGNLWVRVASPQQVLLAGGNDLARTLNPGCMAALQIEPFAWGITWETGQLPVPFRPVSAYARGTEVMLQAFVVDNSPCGFAASDVFEVFL